MSQSQTSPHLFLSALLFLAIVFAAIISIHAIAVTAQDWKMREEDDGAWNNLVGVEEYCKEGKEECLKGRMMHEAHLDYIYTQHHPKP